MLANAGYDSNAIRSLIVVGHRSLHGWTRRLHGEWAQNHRRSLEAPAFELGLNSTSEISKFVANMTGEGQNRARAAAVRAVDKYGWHVWGKAAKLAPIDTGWLKNSGMSDDAKLVGDQIIMTIGFNASYAAAVHERLDLRHKQGQVKYLETAMRTEAPKLVNYVADEVNKAL